MPSDALAWASEPPPGLTRVRCVVQCDCLLGGQAAGRHPALQALPLHLPPDPVSRGRPRPTGFAFLTAATHSRLTPCAAPSPRAASWAACHLPGRRRVHSHPSRSWTSPPTSSLVSAGLPRSPPPPGRPRLDAELLSMLPLQALCRPPWAGRWSLSRRSPSLATALRAAFRSSGARL